MKKQEFLKHLTRFFTFPDLDAYHEIPFQSSESFGDESAPALASPLNWSTEAVAVMGQAACKRVPSELIAAEENTVPSWLWRHHRRGTALATENDLRDIFDRVVGSAAAKAWKMGLFAHEKQARVFFDETRYALMQRHIAIAPDVLASWGLNWAYGIDEASAAIMPHTDSTEISNAAIDALTGKNKNAAPWKKIFAARAEGITQVRLRLSDIAADWHSQNAFPGRAVIDLMALRHNDGSVNIDALRHTARLLCLLLDLQERQDVTIGIANLAPLLMALGLAYDSDAARALAASIAALITAECVAASAEMAALRGASADFTGQREAIMRSLRNHRRAAYGDTNDYERLSVLPAPLPLNNCPDLALAAASQRGWDEALEQAHAFGLRAIHATDLTPSPILGLLLSSATQGLEPMPGLTILQQRDEGDLYRVHPHPALFESLTRLDYNRNAMNIAAQHIAGSHALRKAPGVNVATLRAHHIDAAAIEKIEAYLPWVTSIRYAVTPWIIGVDFCRQHLGVSLRKLESPRFDLLRHLGFSDADIKNADLHIYGHGTLRNAKILHLRHRPIFACGAEVSAEARLRMAASVQSFISGDTGIVVTYPAKQAAERGTEAALSAWRRGLKSLTVIFDAALVAEPAKKSAGRKIKAKSASHARPFASPQRRHSSGKAAPTLLAKKTGNKRPSAKH